MFCTKLIYLHTFTDFYIVKILSKTYPNETMFNYPHKAIQNKLELFTA